MTTKKLTGITIITVWCVIIGTASAFEVKYELNGIDIPEAPRTIDKKLAVIIFDDARPAIEISARARSEALVEKSTYYTEDEPYTIDRSKDTATVAQQISKAIAKHFAYCNLFKKADYVSIKASDISEAKNTKTLKKHDLVMMGTIKHYYGFYKTAGEINNNAVAGGMAACAVGGAAGGAIGGLVAYDQERAVPKKLEGYTQLTDIKLIDLASGKTIWTGEVKEHFKETREDYANTKYNEAHKSLREAINRLVKMIADKSDLK